jgi:regulator of RNase E activity RraA
MKKILFILSVISITLQAQTTAIYSYIDPKPYVETFNSYKVTRMCDDQVVLNKVKNSTVIKSSSYSKKCVGKIFKLKFKRRKTHYEVISEQNNGQVMLIGQYNKYNILIRGFTLYIDWKTRKIKVIDIEDFE